MPFAYFRTDGDLVVPLPGAVGPWMPGALSGTAVGALVASLVDELPAPCPMLMARLSIEFLRPVPSQPLRPQIDIVREGRKQQVVQVSIGVAGQDKQVIRATGVRLRYESRDVAERPAAAREFQPPPGASFKPDVAPRSASLGQFESRVVRQNDFGPGITEAWFRYRGSVFEGRPLTPAMRAGLFADFGNGLAPIVEAKRYTYLNADITLHLARALRGEWVHLKARTLDGGNHLAMVTTEIGDSEGPVGWAHQALLLQPRSDTAIDLSEQT